jgi:osmoprotectant transport system substrate-binding protein
VSSRRLACVLLAACSAAAGCGGGGGGGESGGGGGRAPKPGAGKPPITIGTKNFPEQFVVGQLYRQALEARGFRVVLKSDVGSTEILYGALRRGAVDLYPEYTGTLLSEVAGEGARPPNAQASWRRAKAFAAREGLTLLAPTPFADSDALAVKPAFARKHGLRSVGDLARAPAGTSLGAPPEFRTRQEGFIGLKRLYGLGLLVFKPLQIGEQYRALDRGSVDVADVFTTDGQLKRGRYTLLADPKRLFGFQNLAPLVDTGVARSEGTAFQRTLDAVSSKLTTDAMRRLNASVVLDHRDPAQVAAAFLRANRLR